MSIQGLLQGHKIGLWKSSFFMWKKGYVLTASTFLWEMNNHSAFSVSVKFVLLTKQNIAYVVDKFFTEDKRFFELLSFSMK